MRIEGAEITLWLENGEQKTMDLSLLELATMLKAIGYDPKTNAVFGENTLAQILEGKINPFVLREADEEN